MAYKIAFMISPGEKKKKLTRNHGLVHSPYELVKLSTLDGLESHFTLFGELAVFLNCEKQKTNYYNVFVEYQENLQMIATIKKSCKSNSYL